MANYIYNVFEVEHCHECTGDRELRFSSTKKWLTTKWLSTNVLGKGLPLTDYQVFRSRDGIADESTEVDVYEFMNVDLGEVL